MKSVIELNRLLLKSLLLCYVKFSHGLFKVQLSRDNLGKQKVLEKEFSGFQRA